MFKNLFKNHLIEKTGLEFLVLIELMYEQLHCVSSETLHRMVHNYSIYTTHG